MENPSPALAHNKTVGELGKEEAPQVYDLQGFIMVRDDGLEPSTQGLRIPCSTN